MDLIDFFGEVSPKAPVSPASNSHPASLSHLLSQPVPQPQVGCPPTPQQPVLVMMFY